MEIFEKALQDLGGYLPRIIAAVIVLVLGWLVAWFISSMIQQGLHRAKLDDRMARGTGSKYETEHWISLAFFWLIMLLTIITFFSVLKLPPIAESLKTVIDEVFVFLPRLLAAGVLFLIAWALAGTLRFIISKTLEKARFDDRFSKKTVAGEEGQIALSRTLANTAYWLVFLLFLPAILSTLALKGILTPVERMVEKIVAFVPNVLVAGLILLAGWFMAKIVRRIVTNVLVAIGADRLGEKIGMGRAAKGFSLSQVLGLVVYILILIPVVIAALDAVKLEGITQPASNMLGKILGATPYIFAAILVLAIAYVLGRMLGKLAANLLEAVNFNALPAKLGIGKEAEKAKWAPSEIVGHLILVTIMLFAFVSALNLLRFDSLANLFSRFLVLFGHILLGLVIFAFGLYLANLASAVVKSRDFAQAGMLSIVVRVAVLLLAGAMALRQMGLANEIITIAFGLALGAVAVAAAIAFGIGGRDIAAHKLDEWTKSISAEGKRRT